MRPEVEIRINGSAHRVPADASLAVALLKAGIASFRRSVTGEPRQPLCGMGVCFECRVTIDGIPHQRSCQIAVRAGMEVETA